MSPNRKIAVFGGACCALLIAGLFFLTAPARADIGLPPLNPAGASPGLPEGFTTNVRMVSEEVNLTVDAHERTFTEEWEDSPGHHMRALVDAVFQMRNLGQSDEAFDVWFPLAALTRYPGILADFPDNVIQDFQVWIDGEPTGFEKVMAPDVSAPQRETAWARFPVSFPAGQDVIVRVSYTFYPTGRRPFGGFEYILQTGAGWKDTIGEATISVYLPDTITAENMSLSGSSIEGYPLAPSPSGYVIENNFIRWHFTDLEPTAEHNIFVDVLEPLRYRALQKARGAAQNQPDSVAAQLELARASRDAVVVLKVVGKNGGGLDLAEQANQAYRRAIELAPQRVDLVREYAQWLLSSAGYVSLMRDAACPPELCELLEQGLKDFPGDPELAKMNEDIRLMVEENAPYATQRALDLAATAAAETAHAAATQAAGERATQQAAATAAALAAPSPTSAQAPAAASATPLPATEPTATSATEAEASPQTPGGICPSIAVPLVGLAGVLLVARRRRGWLS